jgi:hypothetical protein
MSNSALWVSLPFFPFEYVVATTSILNGLYIFLISG